MADDYKVMVKITVTRGPEETSIYSEDTAWSGLSFRKMTGASAEYYKLLPKISKAVK